MSASRDQQAPSEGGQGILDALATPVFAVDRSHHYTAFNRAHAADLDNLFRKATQDVCVERDREATEGGPIEKYGP